MFPIPFNFPFRKSDGSLSTIGAEIGGGGGSAVDTTARERANAAYALAETADTKATNAATAASTADNKAVTADGKAVANKNAIDDIVNVYGSKNLLVNNLVSGTYYTVDVTHNNDGSVTVEGRATQGFNRNVVENMPIKKGNYIISCYNSDDDYSSNKYFRLYYKLGGGSNVQVNGKSKTLTIDNDTTLTAWIFVSDSYDFTTAVTFYPMIRCDSIQDDTYIPYAKTNKELTDDLANLPSGGGGLYSKTFTTELTSTNVTKKRTISDSNNVDTCVWEVKNIINQSGYIPIGVIVGDNYTGYYSVGSIQKTGNDYSVEILSTYAGNSYDEFSPLTVIYAPTSGVTPIT